MLICLCSECSGSGIYHEAKPTKGQKENQIQSCWWHQEGLQVFRWVLVKSSFLLPFPLTPAWGQTLGIGCFWNQSQFLNGIERFHLTALESEWDLLLLPHNTDSTFAGSMFPPFQPSLIAVCTSYALEIFLLRQGGGAAWTEFSSYI